MNLRTKFHSNSKAVWQVYNYLEWTCIQNRLQVAKHNRTDEYGGTISSLRVYILTSQHCMRVVITCQVSNTQSLALYGPVLILPLDNTEPCRTNKHTFAWLFARDVPTVPYSIFPALRLRRLGRGFRLSGVSVFAAGWGLWGALCNVGLSVYTLKLLTCLRYFLRL